MEQNQVDVVFVSWKNNNSTSPGISMLSRRFSWQEWIEKCAQGVFDKNAYFRWIFITECRTFKSYLKISVRQQLSELSIDMISG